MISITNCGHDSRHKKPCDIQHRIGLPNYLILLIKQTSWFYSNKKREIIKPNSVLLFPPGTPIHYGCDTCNYNDDWIHFSVDPSDSLFLEQFQFPKALAMHPRDFHRLSNYVRIISNEFHSLPAYQADIMNHLMHVFLYALRDELEKQSQTLAAHKYYKELSHIRTQIYNSPTADWSINHLAQSLCISCSHFQHLYKSFFSCSCQQDIILARLELSKFYLIHSGMSIYQLSNFCGYESDLHFMRQFKKYIGLTPTEYRTVHSTS